VSKKDVTFALDVTMVGVDEREAKSVAADIIELCTFLLDEGRAPNSIVAGALLAATMLATDMVETDGPMH
jgi:hypothetical protein